MLLLTLTPVFSGGPARQDTPRVSLSPQVDPTPPKSGPDLDVCRLADLPVWAVTPRHFGLFLARKAARAAVTDASTDLGGLL